MRVAIPQNWWCYSEAVSQAHQRLLSYTAAIIVDARHRRTGQRRTAAISCFLLLHRGRGLLTTAGHAVKQLAALMEAEEWQITEARLADAPSHFEPIANSLVLPLTTLRLAAIEVRHHQDSRFDGVDLGFIELDRLTFAGLARNPSVAFFAADRKFGWTLPKPEGLYLLGVPGPSVSGFRDSNGSGVIIGHTCLPVRRLKHPPRDMCQHAHSLYGTVKKLSVNGRPLATIRGMSGGPLVAVRRFGRRVQYQIAGIQSTWVPTSRHIRATSIEQLIDLLDFAIDDPSGFTELERDGGTRCRRCAFEE